MPLNLILLQAYRLSFSNNLKIAYTYIMPRNLLFQVYEKSNAALHNNILGLRVELSIKDDLRLNAALHNII